MGKKKTSSKRKTGTPKRNAGSDTAHSDPAASVSDRSLGRDILYGLIVCVVFFVLLEAGLRVAGVAARPDRGDPYVGFASIRPLFRVENGQASTAAGKERFFNEVSFPAKKPKNTVRIFCFGGSTVYGRPYDGRTAFPRWLKELLTVSCPDRRFEVINAGGISYASYRIVPIVKECLDFEPDLTILYTGHNEFLERRTYAGMFDQGATLVNVRAVLDRLHVYRALQALLLPAIDRDDGAESDSGAAAGHSDARVTRPVLEEEVTAVLDRSAGLDLYHRDTEFSNAVAEHFEHNLRRIVGLCRDADVPLLIVKPSSNLKDFSPFKSEHSEGLSTEQSKHIEEKLKQARDSIDSNRPDEALTVLGECIAQDPLYAESHFLRGRALVGTKDYAQALSAFVRARDLDVCPLRCTTPLLERIVKVAQSEDVPLLDFGATLKARMKAEGSRTGIPGDESFMDHVHPVIACHQRLAEVLLDRLEEKGFFTVSHRIDPTERDKLYARIMNGLDSRFFAEKDLNLAKVLKWAGKNQEAEVAVRRAAQSLNDHPEVHKILGGLLMDRGKEREAIAAYEKAVELSDRDPKMLYALGVAYHRGDRRAQAVDTFRGLVRGENDLPDAYTNLAMLHLQAGEVDDALRVLKKALSRHPKEPSISAAYGLALAVSGKPGEGIEWMHKALKREPGNPDYLYNLAGMYALTGDSEKALEHLGRAVKNGYDDKDKIARDPVFETLRSDSRFRELVR